MKIKKQQLVSSGSFERFKIRVKVEQHSVEVWEQLSPDLAKIISLAHYYILELENTSLKIEGFSAVLLRGILNSLLEKCSVTDESQKIGYGEYLIIKLIFACMAEKPGYSRSDIIAYYLFGKRNNDIVPLTDIHGIVEVNPHAQEFLDLMIRKPDSPTNEDQVEQ